MYSVNLTFVLSWENKGKKKKTGMKWEIETVTCASVVIKLLNSVTLNAWVVAVLMKDLVMKSLILHFLFYQAKSASSRRPSFVVCQLCIFHCTVEGCIMFVYTTLCKSTVFLYGFYFRFAPFLWLPITIKCKTASLSDFLSACDLTL